MAIHEDYENSTLIQRMIAFFGSVVGGIIIAILGVLGATGEYVNLPKYGFDIWTVPCYAIIVICGFLILARVRYATIVGIAAGGLDFICYLCMQLSTTAEVGFLVLLKLGVIVCLLQLGVVIESFTEDAPAPVHRQLPPSMAPRGRQIPNRNAARAPMQNRRPPQPRR